MFLVRLSEEAGPNMELAWLLYAALGFFFLMVIVGWLTSRRKGSEPEAGLEAHGHSEKMESH